jgi:glycosyltransferase involved in cell wall biosynthesis
VQAAHGEVIVVMDGDLQHEPALIPKMLEALQAGHDIVSGSRFMKGAGETGLSDLRRALQGYLRNPLADPGTLGISSMAAFGAVLSIFFGAADLHPWVLPSSGVAGAFLGMAALFLLAGMTASPLTLILAGVILSSLGAAGIALVLSLSPPLGGGG